MVWSIPVESVPIDDRFTIESSSVTVVDGDMRVIVSGADFPQPVRSAVLHGDREAVLGQPGLGTLGLSVEDPDGDNEANRILGA